MPILIAASLTTSIVDLTVGSNSLIQGTQTTFQVGDTITASGDNNTLSLVDSGAAAWTLPAATVSGVQTIKLQNVNGGPVVPAVPAVAQITTITAKNASADGNDITVTYGTQTQVIADLVNDGTAATGAAANAVLIAAAINGMAGATIAVATDANVVVTAPVAGTPLPAINFSSATVVADYPTIASTRANVVGVPASGGTFTDTIDADNFVGATNFVSTKSTGAVAVNDLVQGQSVEMNSGSAAMTGTYKSTATAGTLNVTGGNTAGIATIAGGALMTSATVNSTGGAQSSTAGNVNTLTSMTLPTTVTTLNINAATSLATGTITAAGLTSIIASGVATTVNLGTLAATVTTVNGSGLTAGGITATLTGAVTSFTGGAGTDTVTTAATTAATAAISGGAGSGDILVLAATNDVTTAAKAAQYTNFEVLRNTTVTTVDMSVFGSGYTSLQTNASGAGFQNLTATQAGNIRVALTNASPTFALANPTGTTDVLGLTLQNLTAAAAGTAIDVTGITANGFETLNIVSSAGTQNALTAAEIGNDVTFTAAANLTAINVSGAYDLDISGSNLAKAVTLTATNTATFAAQGDFYKGSTIQGNNTLNLFTIGGADADNGSTYIGGTGNDEFTSTKALLVPNGTFDTVLNGGSGTDTVTISDTTAGTVADSSFTNVSNMEALTFASTGAFAFASGGLFNAAYSTGATVTAAGLGNVTATVDLSLYNKNAIINVTTASVDAATVVNGGSGADVINVSALAYTGGAGDMSVSGGAGNDSITVNTIATGTTSGVVVITGGAGADTIVVTAGAVDNANAVTYVVNAGDSTITAWDNVSGFRTAAGTGDLSDLISVAGTATVVANTTGQAASGYTNVIFSVTNGVLSFTGTGASGLALTDMVTIAQQAATANLSSVAFRFGANSYVYNENSGGDSLIQLNLVSIVGLTADATTATAGYVAIG